MDAEVLESWHKPSTIGKSKTAGIDINNPRLLAVMEALIALPICLFGITFAMLAEKVREIMGVDQGAYTIRQSAYDLKKFRVKQVMIQGTNSQTYMVTEEGLQTMTAYFVLRDKVLIPLLGRACKRRTESKPAHFSKFDAHCENIQIEMQNIFDDPPIAA